jgi:hypothetical protein
VAGMRVSRDSWNVESPDAPVEAGLSGRSGGMDRPPEHYTAEPLGGRRGQLTPRQL